MCFTPWLGCFISFFIAKHFQYFHYFSSSPPRKFFIVNYSGIWFFSQRTFITLCNSYCDDLLINGLFFYTNPGNLIIQVIEVSVHYFCFMMISKLRTGKVRASISGHFSFYFLSYMLSSFFFLVYELLLCITSIFHH